MTFHDRTSAGVTVSPEYRELCATLSAFCDVVDDDEWLVTCRYLEQVGRRSPGNAHVFCSALVGETRYKTMIRVELQKGWDELIAVLVERLATDGPHRFVDRRVPVS